MATGGDNDVRIRVRVDNDTRQGLNSAEQDTDRSTGKMAGAFEKLGAAGAAAGGVIAAGLAVATAAAAVLKKALDASIERTDIGNKIEAQLGDTSHIGAWGKLAGAVYADNFGESLEEAGNAVRDVIRSKLLPPDAADSAIKAMAEKLLTVGSVVEMSSTEVARAVRKLLVTGLAGSAEEALDLITKASQKGVDEAGDLLDTVTEYSIQFKELGLNAKEAFGLISQGLAAGARDGDTVADTLKEIAIRAQDGSKGSVEAFKQLGLNGKQLGQMFASGGAEARKAFDMVLDKTKMIKDPMERNAIAVGLFGTKAEDLQDALFGLDLDKAADELGDVAGAADKASEALGKGIGPAIETLKRKAQMAFADFGDVIAPVVMDAVELYQEAAGKLGDVFEGSEVPGEVLDSLRKVADDYGPKLREALGFIVDKIRDNKDEFEKLGHVLAEYIIPAFGWILINGLKETASAIGFVIDAFGVLVNAGQAVRDFAINMALEFLNAFDLIVQGASKGFGWIPGIGPKLDQAAREVHEFVNKVNNELKNIRDEDVYVRTHFVGGQGQSRGGSFRTGGISTAATGGNRSGLVEVGEEGRELVRLPQGSSVYPRANANLMDAQASGAGGVQRIEIYITGDDSRAAQYAIDTLNHGVKMRGGNVQLAVMGSA